MVRDLIPEANQEQEILLRLVVEWALARRETTRQVPVPEAAVPGPLEASTVTLAAEVAVLDFSAVVVGMEQVCPGDVHHHDEGLGLEPDLRVVEHLHCRQGGIL